MNPNPSSLRATGAFTLTELLVSIAVAAILAALLFSGVKKALITTNQAADTGNMRKISLAISLFKRDHFDEGRIFLANDQYGTRPDYGSKAWFQVLRPYCGAILSDPYTSVAEFISPGDPAKGGARTNFPNPGQAYKRRSYSFNIGTLDTSNRTQTWREAMIRNPSKLMLFCNHNVAKADTAWVDPSNPASVALLPNWYGAFANFAFLDGHVESIKIADVLPGGSRNRIFVPEIER